MGSDSDVFEVRTGFDPLRLLFLPNSHKHRPQRQAEQSRSHSVFLLHPTGAFELSLFSGVNLEKHSGGLLTIALGDEPRKR